MRAGWGGRLLLGDGAVAYFGAGSTAARHSHDAIQVVWSFDAPVVVHTGTDEWSARACIVPTAVDHSFSATGGPLVLLLVEPSGSRGRALQQFALRSKGIELAPVLEALRPSPSQVDTPERTLSWCNQVISALIGRELLLADLVGIRAEVRSALEYVVAELDSVPRLKEAARRTNLSSTRLTHLFSSQGGMPFRRFVLWKRLEHVVAKVQCGHDLTTASASAGFSDSAHFSRVFRSTFGLAPSAVLPHLEIVTRAHTTSSRVV